ncbi:CheR family methyltransferase [Methylobacillus flagellatus]|uniref:CheR family methyltransferase n=1 Tax=Methylobacillus flagellatus TaxID=405 RepID=UPI0010F609BD|nr:CheR family methyltransferase [Methylobacillus flagellatus]
MSKALHIREREFSFTEQDFRKICKLIYQHAGISLSDAKTDMVYSRIARQLRAGGFDSFSVYLDHLERHGTAADWQAFTNALTTNLTSFFREVHHFPILMQHLRSVQTPIELWCSAASTGEEPYSMAIAACEAFGTLKPPVRILATDIDTNVLATASQGVYSDERIENLSEQRKKTYFLRGKGSQEGLVRVREELRQLISFRPLNLLAEQWGIRSRFDAIFCRNVMIYFDKPTQSQILNRFPALMKPDALLFAGHSENFMYASNAFRLQGKTVYELRAQPGNALHTPRPLGSRLAVGAHTGVAR